MIEKPDLLLLLKEIEKTDPAATTYINVLYSPSFSKSKTLKFINDHRPLEIISFYEKLRKCYNEKKSKLYINIVKEDFDDLDGILTTLSSYVLQVLLYSKNVENEDLFLRSSRVKEVTQILTDYFDTYDIENCKKILSYIKADIKAFEDLKGI